VLGGSGFAGAEILRLLLDHPRVEVAFISSEAHEGEAVTRILHGLRNHPGVTGMVFQSIDSLPSVDVIFSCLPVGQLPARLADVLGRGEFIFNLGGDFRLKGPEEIRRYYPASAEYWPYEFPYYVPEMVKRRPASGVVSLPGCMAAAAIYALYPLSRASLIERYVVVDAKTGSSGGGRHSAEHVSDRANNFRVHRIHGHRHAPEILQAIRELTGSELKLQFSAYSLELPRGVFVSAYTLLRPGIGTLDVKRAYANAYREAPFIRMRSSHPASPYALPMIKAVLGTNVAELACGVEDDRCVTVVALDNLVKGAGGQALQAMNRIMGYGETLGLPMGGLWP
jgi:N-acetyl-gamma-glutamyl-phosphate reductase